ncbi:dTMP kinase [Megasphaera vaginalis (ex Bordigoni et al. 2020)]|uniref:dTMP kinase n=1 Tax=Megasphaera vaginalis (ex Bordigoni et al. 2020) TaxID=2045301 RepID=UPI000C7DB090|nr:thymidylate kinase [Megasphaera vaginalis (ex Bordigoni et al. 2020)]
MTRHLFIIEGGDGSGKATQTKLLAARLRRDGFRVKSVSFPDYDSESSALVRMYLRGDFGTAADAVNPYAASAFYAVDRFASYQTGWKDFLAGGGIVLADRYTTSNMLYQMIKIDDQAERKAYLQWLWDFEFTKMALPVPEKVFLLDVPLAVTERLMARRQGKTGGATGDIHERDRAFLRKCHDAYGELAAQYGWQTVTCTAGGEMKTAEAIHDELYCAVISVLA